MVLDLDDLDSIFEKVFGDQAETDASILAANAIEKPSTDETLALPSDHITSPWWDDLFDSEHRVPPAPVIWASGDDGEELRKQVLSRDDAFQIKNIAKRIRDEMEGIVWDHSTSGYPLGGEYDDSWVWAVAIYAMDNIAAVALREGEPVLRFNKWKAWSECDSARSGYGLGEVSSDS